MVVSLGCDDHAISVSIQDNGAGLPAELTLEQVEVSLHFGLAAMRNLVLDVGGEFSIGNNDDGGALVRVQLPLDQRENQ